MTGKDFLYRLLPSFIRYRDAYEGEPLRALMEVLEGEFEVIRQDLGHFYENWFIETCDPWVVPYIGDLLGVHGLIDPKHFLFSQRTQVANTIGYRRRKGTAATLSRVVEDTTGWPSHVVAGASGLAMTTSLRFPRPAPSGTIDLTDADALDNLANPFRPVPRTVSVWSPAPSPDGEPATAPEGGPGLFNLSNLALYLWRLQAYPVDSGEARAMKAPGVPAAPGETPLYYAFSPFGDDRPLFNLPRTPGLSSRAVADEESVPGPLRRRPLALETQALRDCTEPSTRYFAEPPVFEIALWRSGGTEAVAVHPEEILICDLASGRAPSAKDVSLAVDPELGRIVLSSPAAKSVERVLVSYSYGWSADVGGGPYVRRDTLAEAWKGVWEAVVSSQTMDDRLSDPERSPRPDVLLYGHLGLAFAAWTKQEALLRILDNGTYVFDDPVVLDLAPKGRRHLVLEAADGRCPSIVFRRGLTLRGATLEPGDTERLRVVLNGLWIEGQVTVSGDVELTLLHCTLRPSPGNAPGTPVVEASGAGPEARVSLSWSVTGPLCLARTLGALTVRDSLVDGGSGPAISGSSEEDGEKSGPPATLERCTIFGSVSVDSLALAEDVLFTAPVLVRRLWNGEVRNSHVPEGSRVPGTLPRETAPPTFVSRRFGDPGYAQLGPRCPREIAAGGTDGSEIGVFHSLYQPYRRAHLPATLAEYVPWGLSARVVYVT